MMKEFKSIQIGDNICVVDEKAEIKRLHWYVVKVYDRYELRQCKSTGSQNAVYSTTHIASYKNDCLRVLGSTDPLPNLQVLIIKDKWEELKFTEARKTFQSPMEKQGYDSGFRDGFRANDKKFTREDMCEFVQYAEANWNAGTSSIELLRMFQEKEKEKQSILLIQVTPEGEPVITGFETINIY